MVKSPMDALISFRALLIRVSTVRTETPRRSAISLYLRCSTRLKKNVSLSLGESEAMALLISSLNSE